MDPKRRKETLQTADPRKLKLLVGFYSKQEAQSSQSLNDMEHGFRAHLCRPQGGRFDRVRGGGTEWMEAR